LIWQRTWQRPGLAGLARGSLALVLAATLYASANAIAETRDLIRETGGRGRWSHSLVNFIRELDSRPNAEELEVISLDWGFHEPLLFLSNHIRSTEPIWALSSGRGYILEGNPNTLYLIHPPHYDLLQLGSRFETALRFVDAADFERRDYFDGEGQPTFSSIRFVGPHRIFYDGLFRIRLSE
jgi:hypothetical protein